MPLGKESGESGNGRQGENYVLDIFAPPTTDWFLFLDILNTRIITIAEYRKEGLR